MPNAKKRMWLLVVLSLLVLVGFFGGRALLGFRTLTVPGGAQEIYSTQPYAASLASAVRQDGVDYEALETHKEGLLKYIRTLAIYSPRTHPNLFPTHNDQLAYYINAYNAFVLYGVLFHHPQNSIHEVRGWIEPVAGFGFFWGQNFILGGSKLNLYNLENTTIRSFGDARAHAAINCASASCPSLLERPYTPESLDEELSEAAAAWVDNETHVAIQNNAIYLSAIFDWFKVDFENHAQTLEVGDSVLDWIHHYLPEKKRKQLTAARESHTPIRYNSYDWTLNRADILSKK